MKKLSEEVQEWVDYADEDLRAAQVLLREGIYNQACFHAQQCAEKMLKAVLLHHGQPLPKIHDLNELFEKSVAENLLDLLPFREQVATLSLYYVPTRYPDAMLGALPDRLPGKRDAAEAVEFADELTQLIRKKLFA